jgi:hypothetical protein
MFLSHGRQDKQHLKHRNKISFRALWDLRSRLSRGARGRKTKIEDIGTCLKLRRSEIFIA